MVNPPASAAPSDITLAPSTRRGSMDFNLRPEPPNTQVVCPALSNNCSHHVSPAPNQRRTIAMEDRPGCISIADVQHAVARAFCLSIGEMLSRKRRHRLAGARKVAMYLSRELAGGGWMG